MEYHKKYCSSSSNSSSSSRKVILWSHVGTSMKVFLGIIFASFGFMMVTTLCLLPSVMILSYVLAVAVARSGYDAAVELAFKNHGAHKYFNSSEKAECCICLSCYEEEEELHVLPCKHYFHNECIARWLNVNPSCPLCKYRVLYKVDLS